MDIFQSLAGAFTAYAHEKITAAAVPIGFTAGTLSQTDTQVHRDFGPARLVLVTSEQADMRYTVDGTTPLGTADGVAVGHLLPNGSGLSFANKLAMKNFLAVRETATSGILRVTYFR